MRGIAFRCCPLVLFLHPLLSVFFFFKGVSFVKLTLLDECRGDHGGERHGDDLVR